MGAGYCGHRTYSPLLGTHSCGGSLLKPGAGKTMVTHASPTTGPSSQVHSNSFHPNPVDFLCYNRFQGGPIEDK